jgi:hypothetical protein
MGKQNGREDGRKSQLERDNEGKKGTIVFDIFEGHLLKVI